MANTTSTVSIVWGNRMEIKAGTPIDSSSNFANNGTAVGIVAVDAYRGDATATVITAGEWNEDFGAANAGVRISDDCKRALPAISFIDDDGTRIPAKSLPIPTEENAGKQPIVDENGNVYALGVIPSATTETAGTVKMAAAVADSAEETSPTTAEFNALLAALRAAGIIAPTPVEE